MYISDDEYDRAFVRAMREAEARGEEFDEDEWRRQRMLSEEDPSRNDPLDPEDEWVDESFDETGFEETEEWDVDTFVDDIEQSLINEEGFPDETEDAPLDETEEGFEEGEDVGEAEDPELDETYDPWTEDDHRQQYIRRGSESSSNRGLYEAGQSAGNFYETHLDSEDGHGNG
jgi:hypothetical protein